MNIVIDIILAVIIAGCIIQGAKKGFVFSLLHTLSFFIAAIGSYLLYGYVADFAYKNLFLPKISGMISTALGIDGTKVTLAELFSDKPKFFVDTLNRFSNVSEVEAFYNSNEGIGSKEISEFMASPIADVLSKVLCFIAVFIVLLIILRIVTFILDRICRLPLLNTANKLLGTIFGVITGVLTAWLLSRAFTALLPKLSVLSPKIFSEDLGDTTILLRYLSKFDPISFFIK